MSGLKVLIQVMEQRIFSLGIKEQVTELLHNVNEANIELTRIEAASSVCVT